LTTEDRGESGHWTLDRRVPVVFVITVVGALFAQTAVGAYWASKMQSDITAASNMGGRNEVRIDGIQARQALSDTTAARMDERLGYIQRTLDRIAAAIDKRDAAQ
jgi:hypothetical protein